MPAARRRKLTLLAAGTLAAATLCAGGVLWEDLWQWWWVRRLGAADAETRRAAALALARCASRLRPSVVPLLVNAIEAVPGAPGAHSISRPAVVTWAASAPIARKQPAALLASRGMNGSLYLQLIVDHVGPVFELSGDNIRAAPEVHAEIDALLEYVEPRIELFDAIFAAAGQDTRAALGQILGLDASPRWMREAARLRLVLPAPRTTDS